MNFIWLVLVVIVILVILSRSKKNKNSGTTNKKIDEKKKLNDPVVMNLHKDNRANEEESKFFNEKKEYNDSIKKNRGKKRKEKDSETKIENVDIPVEKADLHEEPVEIKKSEDIEKTNLQKSNMNTKDDSVYKKSNLEPEKFPLIIKALTSENSLSNAKLTVKSENTKSKKWSEIYPKEEKSLLNLNIENIKNSFNIENIFEFLNNTSEIPAVLKKKDTESYEFTSSNKEDITNILKRYDLDLNASDVYKITSKIKINKENSSILEIADIISKEDERYYFENKF